MQPNSNYFIVSIKALLLVLRSGLESALRKTGSYPHSQCSNTGNFLHCWKQRTR